ncbi:11231_t:CDS:2 [Ambispora gerdemannii]|uniref:11231_t:CDS:1 n=1 Tax=Ambispora gerdemannii TaxID=144530 RepID=A0A9N9AMX6_9GLOM|nr:11231_t:CDS:2 [Ambispora gerdemannii]
MLSTQGLCSCTYVSSQAEVLSRGPNADMRIYGDGPACGNDP